MIFLYFLTIQPSYTDITEYYLKKFKNKSYNRKGRKVFLLKNL